MISNRKLILTKNLFTISLIVIALTILSVWFYGLGNHQTVIENSIISTSILSVAFFLFLAVSLYNGVKLKDNLGTIVDKFDSKKIDYLKDFSFSTSPSSFDIGDGIGRIILNILIWIIATLVVSFLFYALGAILWIFILTFLGMLYWVFFRALRLIFKKSYQCHQNIESSIYYALAYTLVYNFWIFTIFFLVNYFN